MTSTKSVKVPNYSETQIAAIRSAAPINMAIAKELATKLGKTYRSVIAKAKSEGIEYIPKVVAAKRVGGATKSQMISNLVVSSGIPAAMLEGLEKATSISIAALVSAFEKKAESEKRAES